MQPKGLTLLRSGCARANSYNPHTTIVVRTRY